MKNTYVCPGDLIVLGNIETQGEGVGGGSHGHSLVDLALFQENSTLTSNEKFNNKHVLVLVEYETDGVHYGASVNLHPYNGSICLSSYLIGQQILTGYIDEEGHIVLSIPQNITPTNIKAHYIILK